VSFEPDKPSSVLLKAHRSKLTALQAVYFLLHCPAPTRNRAGARSRCGGWALPTAAPCGARTFLPGVAPAATVRPTDKPNTQDISWDPGEVLRLRIGHIHGPRGFWPNRWNRRKMTAWRPSRSPGPPRRRPTSPREPSRSGISMASTVGTVNWLPPPADGLTGSAGRPSPSHSTRPHSACFDPMRQFALPLTTLAEKARLLHDAGGRSRRRAEVGRGPTRAKPMGFLRSCDPDQL